MAFSAILTEKDIDIMCKIFTQEQLYGQTIIDVLQYIFKLPIERIQLEGECSYMTARNLIVRAKFLIDALNNYK
jgi:hypothetical protein